MFWVLTILAVVVALVGIAFGVGASLPRDHVATVRATFAASPDKIWAVVSDPYSAGAWRKDVKKVEKLPDVNGKPSWREEGGFGPITYVLTESTPPASRTTLIADEALPYGGEWRTTIRTVGAQTEVSITEAGFVKPPLFRFMARFIFGYTSSLSDYLTALGAHLGESVTPEVVAAGK